MTNPVVSVVMAVHNGERHVAQAINSILSQTLREIEIIVIDDASTDQTRALVEAFEDHRLRLIPGAKRGISLSLNEGLNAASCEFVARLDADDIMEPSRLKSQHAYLSQRPELGGTASHYWLIDDQGRVRGSHRPNLLTVQDVALQLSCGGRLVYAHPTVMMRKSAALAVGGYDPVFDGCEDVDLFLRMYEAGWPILVQPEKLTRFRVHADSVTSRSVRSQYFLNETIFGNYQRRRQGLADRPVSWYIDHGRRTPIERLITEGRIMSRRLQRASTVARMQGRPIAAALALFAATSSDPNRAMGVVLRKLVRRKRVVT